jgi:ubiquinone/menaquinone biosynthesis C-methylase UbiE
VPLRILDVGCGAGELLHEMVVRVPYGEAYVGVEDDPEALAAARRRADPRMEFRAASPEALPFADASFDLVVASSGVLAWRDPAAGTAELGRVVSDGGRVVVAERSRAGRTVRELFERAGLSYERDEPVARAAFVLPVVRAFIASP